jgi:hypothetical protein
MSEDIVKKLRVPPDLMTDFGRVGLFGEAAVEIERLREQLHLANIDAVGAHAEANELRKHLIKAVALIIRLIDTRRCSVGVSGGSSCDFRKSEVKP